MLVKYSSKFFQVYFIMPNCKQATVNKSRMPKEMYSDMSFRQNFNFWTNEGPGFEFR
jgi:hypothetical protein